MTDMAPTAFQFTNTLCSPPAQLCTICTPLPCIVHTHGYWAEGVTCCRLAKFKMPTRNVTEAFAFNEKHFYSFPCQTAKPTVACNQAPTLGEAFLCSGSPGMLYVPLESYHTARVSALTLTHGWLGLCFLSLVHILGYLSRRDNAAMSRPEHAPLPVFSQACSGSLMPQD